MEGAEQDNGQYLEPLYPGDWCTDHRNSDEVVGGDNHAAVGVRSDPRAGVHSDLHRTRDPRGRE